MQFEVNGQTYVLRFAEEVGEWYLLTAIPGLGIRNIEIENDDGQVGAPFMLPIGQTNGTIN